MGKCKNCGNETKNDNVYCSLTCRNIYVNKNLRDYSKYRETMKYKKEKNINDYLQNPIKCKFCDEIISFEKMLNGQEFCSHSCSAKFNNKLRKGIKHNLSEEQREKLKKLAVENFKGKVKIDLYKEEKEIYYENPNRCINCDKILEFKYRNRINCSLKCKKEYYAKNKETFDLYKALTKFKFNLKDFTAEFDFGLIEKYGWYSAKNNGNNEYGVSRDHMFSIKEGFRRLINPLLLAHPANCELIVNKNNQSKCDKCSINIDELLERIEIFENRYGKYYDKELKIYVELEELKQLLYMVP